MDQGESQIRTFRNRDIISIIATNGIIMSLYNNGQKIENLGIGDVSSTIVPGIIQYDNNYVFSTIDNFPTHWLCVIMHTTYDFDDLSLDAQSVTGNPTMPIIVPEWGTYHVMFIQIAAGRHTLSHMNENARYGAIVYGYTTTDGSQYSFPVGMRL